MATRLKFTIPKGSETFYRHVNPDGQFARVVFVGPGDTVDEARVMDAQDYIDRGMATRVEAAETTAAAPAAKKE